jgi:hypothetical protein
VKGTIESLILLKFAMVKRVKVTIKELNPAIGYEPNG